MPQIKYSLKATQDLERFRDFLNENSPENTYEAINTIIEKIWFLEKMPFLWVSIKNSKLKNLRKLNIFYWKSWYVALYKIDLENDLILIETIRHMRELEPNF